MSEHQTCYICDEPLKDGQTKCCVLKTLASSSLFDKMFPAETGFRSLSKPESKPDKPGPFDWRENNFETKFILPPWMRPIQKLNNEELNSVQPNIPSSLPIEPKEDTFCRVCKETIADDKLLCSKKECIKSWFDPNWHAINKPVLKVDQFLANKPDLYFDKDLGLILPRRGTLMRRGLGTKLESIFRPFSSTKPPNPDLERLD